MAEPKARHDRTIYRYKSKKKKIVTRRQHVPLSPNDLRVSEDIFGREGIHIMYGCMTYRERCW